jgi:repressor LexA
VDKLTERQGRVLRTILRLSEREDRPPTTRELAEELGCHVKTVYQYLLTLERKGCISRRKGRVHVARELRREEEIPILGRIAAGAPLLAVEHIEGRLPLPDWFRRQEGLFALRVRGDSMIDAHICDGDYVIVRQQAQVEEGQIAAVVIRDEATVKRVHIRGRLIRLVPENPAFRPLEYDLGEQEVSVIGRVVGVFRQIPS